jgi:hypothetical protein
MAEAKANERTRMAEPPRLAAARQPRANSPSLAPRQPVNQRPRANDPRVALALSRRGMGQVLAPSLRIPMERRFGADFAGVRLHDDASAHQAADALHAEAFTFGEDIYSSGGALRGAVFEHELAHVVQYQQGRVAKPGGGEPMVSDRGDALEKAAEELTPSAVADVPAAMILRVEYLGDSDVSKQIEKHHEDIQAAFLAEMRQAPAVLDSKYAKWLPGGMQAFMERVFGRLPLDRLGLLKTLDPIAVPDLNWAMSRAVDQEEDTALAFARELRGLFASRLPRSLARMLPRYLMARNQAILREESDLHGTPTVLPEPDEKALIPSHPLDRFVNYGLVSNTIDFDYQSYRERNPAERSAHELHKLNPNIEIFLEVEHGLWTWAYVIDPPDATAEDVANKLYGAPEKAYRIVAAAPMFGFYPHELVDPFRSEWIGKAGAPRPWAGPNAPAMIALQARIAKGDIPEDLDPTKEATEANHDAIALAQAKDYKPTGTNRQDILQQLDMIQHNLTKIASDWELSFFLRAKAIGFGGLDAVRNAVVRRLNRLRSIEDPAETLKWGTHAAAQLDIVMRSAVGVGTAKDRLDTATKLYGGYREIPPYEKVPLLEMAYRYVESAAASELVSTAYERLAEADQYAKTVQIEILEKKLDDANKMSGESKASWADGINVTAGDEEKLRARLVKARELVITDPNAAADAVKAAETDVGDLHGHAIATHTRIKLRELEAIVWKAGTDLGDDLYVDFKYVKEMFDLLGELQPHTGHWRALEWTYVYGNKLAREAAWKVVQGEKEKLADLLKRINAALDHAAQELKWKRIIHRALIMAVIALITAGFGVYLTGVAAGLELGSFGTFVFVSAGESLFFSAVTTLAFEKDPSIGKFVEGFLTNWATFGAMKGLSALYKGILGPAANTLKGVVGEAVVTIGAQSLLSLKLADRKKRSETGQGLTSSEAEETVAEGVLVAIATMIGGRVTKDFLPDIQVRGFRLGEEISAVNKARAEIRTEVAAIKAAIPDPAAGVKPVTQPPPGPKERVQKLIQDDAALLQQEKEVLTHVQAEVSRNPASPEFKQVQDQVKANNEAVEKNDAMQIASVLEPAGPNELLCEQGKLDEVEAYHRKNPNEDVTASVDADGNRSIAVTPRPPLEGETVHITEKTSPGAESVITRPPERVTGEAEPPPPPESQFKSFDDLVNQDGTFKDPKYEEAYQRYKVKKTRERKPEKNREEWARSQTSSDYRKPLEAELGPDFFKQGDKKTNIRDKARPQAYPPDRYLGDLATIEPYKAKVLDKAGVDPQQGIPGGEMTLSAFNKAKGAVAEILARGKIADILAGIRKQYPNAVILRNLRIRFMNNGKLGKPVETTDALIGYFQGDNLVVLGRIEVKSGSKGGYEATEQFHRNFERNIEEGTVLEIPGKKPGGKPLKVAYGPTRAQRAAGIGQIDGLKRSDTYIIGAKGTGHLGEGSDMQLATEHTRIFELDVTPAEIEYLTRLVLEPYVRPATAPAPTPTPPPAVGAATTGKP